MSWILRTVLCLDFLGYCLLHGNPSVIIVLLSYLNSTQILRPSYPHRDIFCVTVMHLRASHGPHLCRGVQVPHVEFSNAGRRYVHVVHPRYKKNRMNRAPVLLSRRLLAYACISGGHRRAQNARTTSDHAP